MKPIALTYGMGIGPEITVKAIQKYRNPVILMGRKEPLVQASQFLNLSFSLEHVETQFFEDEAEPAEILAIREATKQCLEGSCRALVTGPINKEKLIAKGFKFRGHTEFLGHLCGGKETVMAFTGGFLSVILMTTHIPLQEVSGALSTEMIVRKIQIAEDSWKKAFGKSPRFVVCGLNPHAGEKGVLGREEIEVIDPACEILRRRGLEIIGAVSAETAFLMAKRSEADVVVAMYHDQGLAPLKLVDFGESVNWTLGLPIVRTSVDHGTADSLVGSGKASEASLLAALGLVERVHEPKVTRAKPEVQWHEPKVANLKGEA